MHSRALGTANQLKARNNGKLEHIFLIILEIISRETAVTLDNYKLQQQRVVLESCAV